MMSEFQLKEGQGYIYIGEYFHKFGGQVPTEKKIGKTDNLLKIPQIDDYAFSLDFHTPDIYLVEDVDTLYTAIIVLLSHDIIKEDWFADSDGDLKERVESFMKALGYREIADIDGDGIPDHLDNQIG
jgi:hypothetical protein